MFVLAFQYLWDNFIKKWYEKRLEKKNLRKDEISNKTNEWTEKLRYIVMLLLILAVVLAVSDLIWK